MAHLRWCCTGWFAMTIFSTTERYNIVATLNRMVAMLFQHSKAVLRLKQQHQHWCKLFHVTSPLNQCTRNPGTCYRHFISWSFPYKLNGFLHWGQVVNVPLFQNESKLHTCRAIYNYRSFYVTRLSEQCWWSQSQQNWSNLVIVYLACPRIWHTL